MPSLVVVSHIDGYRVFQITQDTVIIGRGEDADLLLPNISVSRHHAEVAVKNGQVTIKDLESSNGTIVNGKSVTVAQLNSGDEIVLGKFQLAYMGDGAEDRFFKGRYLEYMLKYDASPGRGLDDSTFSISPEELRRKQMESHRMSSAKLVLTKNPSQFWFPEDRGLTMGAEGMIAVDGWFTGGIVAEITWNGKGHILTKHARLVKAQVNEASNLDKLLQNGDRIRVGGTTFRYEVPPME